MYLKRLEIKGFKSFADHVEVEFGPGMTVVVGPNGCGKSNLTEALQWVLGEQNARNLRGLKMEDVIFSGTTRRRPLGMCMVSLTFDNSSHLIPLPFDEVNIARRAYRSGESEYYINKKSCRLRDIQELFASCGIGKAAFSIIPQGRIDEFLTMRPEERRLLLEEAAGVSKYRPRKEAALEKLAETEESLTRIGDIMGELARQRAPLAEQARIAETYHRIDRECRGLELRLLEGKLFHSRDKLRQVEESSQSLEKGSAELRERSLRLEAEFPRLVAGCEALERRVEQLEQLRSSLQQERGHLEITCARDEEKIDSGGRLRKDIEKRLAAACSEREQLTTKQKQLDVQLDDCNRKRQEALRQQAILVERKAGLTQDKLRAQQEWDQLNGELFDLVHRKTALASRIKELGNQRRLMLNQQASREQRRERNQERAQELEQRIRDLSRQLDESGRHLAEAERHREEAEASLKKTAAARENCMHLIHQGVERITTLETRRRILQESEQRLEGYQHGVKEILLAKSHQHPSTEGVLGVVEDLLAVEDQYRTALDVALGRSGQYLVCRDPEVARRGIHYLRTQGRGRATFLPLTAVERWAERENAPRRLDDPDLLGRMVDFIICDQKYRKMAEFLLGRTYLAADLDGARRFAEKRYYRVRVVTLEGDLIQPGGLITGGKAGEQAGITARRKAELAQLETNLAESRCKMDYLKEKEQELTRLWRQYKLQVEEEEQKRRRHSHDKLELEQQLAILSKELQQLNDYTRGIVLEGEQEGDEGAGIEGEIASLQEELTVLFKKEKQVEAARDKAATSRAETETELAALEETLSDLKAALSSWEQELKHLVQESQGLQQEQRRQEAKIAELRGDLERLAAAGEEAKHRHRLTVERLKQLEVESSVTAERLQLYSHKLKACNHFRETREKRIRRLRALIKEGEQRLHSYQLQHHHLAEEITALTTQVGELGFELEEDHLLRSLSRQEENEIKEKIASCRERLAGIGEVNFAAPAAYQQLQERYKYLEEQIRDLEAGKEELKQVIAELDQNVSRRFMATYRQVRENFATIFGELCEGGEADLILTDPDHPLTTGVEMMVSPRGKKPRHLTLLSGGERSLAGIALLFALLRTRPSPFYLLDEIEAFLDEANLNRCAEFLKKMGETSQLVLISHRYQTMEVADALYGITMEEPGVSKLVSVKLSDQRPERRQSAS